MRIGLTEAKGIAAAVGLWLMASAPAVASEGEAGLPQLNPASFAPQLIWLAITFIALYILMSRVALPRIAAVLAHRQERLEGDLARAEALKSEADAVLAAYQKAMIDARAQAQAAIQKAAAEVAAATQQREQAVMAELTKKTAEAERQIASAKQAALSEARQSAAELVAAIGRKVAGVEISAADAKSAIDATAR